MVCDHKALAGSSSRGSLVPPPVWAAIIAAVMWILQRHIPLRTVIEQPWNQAGAWLMALSAVAPGAAIIQFIRARTTVDPHRPQRARKLVTGGLYAWTRNPMYLGLSLLLIGWAVELGSASAFVGPVLFVPLIERVQIRPEERALRARFGAEYDRYCRRVNRWVGRRSPRQRSP